MSHMLEEYRLLKGHELAQRGTRSMDQKDFRKAVYFYTKAIVSAKY
jgi:hypothetical protein